VDPGFDPQRPVALVATIPTAADGSPLLIDCEAVRDRLLRIGGVRSVAYGRSVPLSGMSGGTLKLETPGQGTREVGGGSVGPGFFSVLGTAILRGRDFQAGDDNAVLVNATLARQLDSAGAAVGREIRLDGATRRIVGVFPDAKWASIYERPGPRAIVLTQPRAGGDVTFAVQVDRNPGAYLASLRREIAAALPGSSGGTVKTLQQHYLDSMFFERFTTQALYALGLIALVLTVTGLHGIAAALFARRSKEFAIRLALGAAPGQIARTVLSSGVKLAAVGLAIGLSVAIPGGIYLSSKIFGLSAWSVSAVGFSSVIVLVAAVLAAAHPARRVLRIQPAAIIQAE
jgi:ABC-type antimicrobial peptide transport system permease subunit